MNKKLFRSLILLITYTILLVMLLGNQETVFRFVKQAIQVFKPILFGFAIAFILNQPCKFFTRVLKHYLPFKLKRAARPFAVVFSYVVLLGAITLLVSFIIPELTNSIRTFVGNLSTYLGNLQSLYNWVVNTFDLEMLANLDLSGFSSTLQTLLNEALNTVATAVPQLVGATAKLFSFVVNLFLSVIFSIYLLASGPRLTSQCRRLLITYLPEKLASKVLRVSRLTADTFTSFVTGQVTEAIILGALCFVGMLIFRFQYAPLISVIIAVSALVPIAGAYLGAALSCLLLVMIDPMQAVWFLVFIVVLQQLEGNIIYPRVVGTSIGIPGLWVLAAVTVGGGLFGFAGMLLGVPVTAVLYALLRDDMSQRAAKKAAPPSEQDDPEAL